MSNAGAMLLDADGREYLHSAGPNAGSLHLSDGVGDPCVCGGCPCKEPAERESIYCLSGRTPTSIRAALSGATPRTFYWGPGACWAKVRSIDLVAVCVHDWPEVLVGGSSWRVAVTGLVFDYYEDEAGTIPTVPAEAVGAVAAIVEQYGTVRWFSVLTYDALGASQSYLWRSFITSSDGQCCRASVITENGLGASEGSTGGAASLTPCP